MDFDAFKKIQCDINDRDYTNNFFDVMCNRYFDLLIDAGECCFNVNSDIYTLAQGKDLGLDKMAAILDKIGNSIAAYRLNDCLDCYLSVKHAEEQIRYGNLSKEQISTVTLKEVLIGEEDIHLICTGS